MSAPSCATCRHWTAPPKGLVLGDCAVRRLSRRLCGTEAKDVCPDHWDTAPGPPSVLERALKADAEVKALKEAGRVLLEALDGFACCPGTFTGCCFGTYDKEVEAFRKLVES